MFYSILFFSRFFVEIEIRCVRFCTLHASRSIPIALVCRAYRSAVSNPNIRRTIVLRGRTILHRRKDRSRSDFMMKSANTSELLIRRFLHRCCAPRYAQGYKISNFISLTDSQTRANIDYWVGFLRARAVTRSIALFLTPRFVFYSPLNYLCKNDNRTMPFSAI